MLLQYVDHLAAPVPAVLMSVIFLMLKVPPRWDFQLIILNVGKLVTLKDQQLLCLAYAQSEQSVTLLDNIFFIFLSEAFFILWFVSEIEEC